MEIIKSQEGTTLTLALKGRLDTTTAPSLEAAVKADLDTVGALKFDFKELEYISSAGLRVLLSAQKLMRGKGSMTITNVCDEIMEVFEITGFTDILTIEK